jgi:hypothetical protein
MDSRAASLSRWSHALATLRANRLARLAVRKLISHVLCPPMCAA